MFLAQKKEVDLHVRKSLGKGKDLKLRRVGAQLEHKLDNSRILLFETSANIWRDKVS